MPIAPTGRARYIGDQELEQYNQRCSFYTVSMELGPNDGDTARNARLLRPEPFVVRRIAWATSGDTAAQNVGMVLGSIPGSLQGRSVRVSFGDSFTSFMGQSQGMVSAVFGDSQGFMDLPKGIVFQGSQNLEVSLSRIFYPGPTVSVDFTPPDTRWDFVFAGVDLLPKYLNQSGSE
jgi:hypothetical protein